MLIARLDELRILICIFIIYNKKYIFLNIYVSALF